MPRNSVDEIRDYLRLIPKLEKLPLKSASLSYDSEADVLYINFEKPSLATDSEIIEDEVIKR